MNHQHITFYVQTQEIFYHCQHRRQVIRICFNVKPHIEKETLDHFIINCLSRFYFALVKSLMLPTAKLVELYRLKLLLIKYQHMGRKLHKISDTVKHLKMLNEIHQNRRNRNCCFDLCRMIHILLTKLRDKFN